MAIATDAFSSNTGTTANTDSTHALGSGSDRMMIVTIKMESSSGSTIDNCIFDPGGANEFNLTLVEQADNTPGFVNLCYVYIGKEADLPASGSYTVRAVCTLGTSPGVVICVTTITGADQATPSGAQIDNSTASSSTTDTVNPTVATANSFSVTAISSGATITFTPPSSYNERVDSNIGTMTGANADLIESSTGSKTLTWTGSGSSNRLATIGIIIAPAGAAPAANPGRMALLGVGI